MNNLLINKNIQQTTSLNCMEDVDMTYCIKTLAFFNKNKAEKGFLWYFNNLKLLFKSKLPSRITKKQKLFLAGFMEGEASINVSVKKSLNSKLTLKLDPQFSLTQHISGVNHLLLAMKIFNSGYIRYKSGSKATLVFEITNKQTLKTQILPFYEEFINAYSSETKKNRFFLFKQFLNYFDNNQNNQKDVFVYKMLPLWDSLRMQKGQINQSFENLHEAQSYVLKHLEGKKKFKNNKKKGI